MSETGVNVLAIAAGVLIGLSVLVALLAAAVSLAERTRITVRRWLLAAWFATLAVPALLTAIAALIAIQLTHAPLPFHLSNQTAAEVTIGVGVISVLLTFFTIGWLTGRMVLQPLAVMGDAARQIASGELDVSLPHPMLAEVADVADAFRAMSSGLQTSITEQAEAEQQRRLFISAVAHDLRTPLFALRGYLEGLQTGIAATPEKRARYLEICREQAETLERRVADLFTYSRLEYLGEQPQVAPLDLGALLSHLGESLRPLADERHIALAVDACAGACIVEADEHLLRRAVENVVENALRYTPTGGVVAVTAQRVGDTCQFSVADSGPGIAPADLPHIFSPLYRGESSRNRQTGGAGLGLTVARTTLRRHGGDLRAANRDEGGALFTGTLPAATRERTAEYLAAV